MERLSKSDINILLESLDETITNVETERGSIYGKYSPSYSELGKLERLDIDLGILQDLRDKLLNFSQIS